MGREARVRAEVDDRAGDVTALLEARELILRGDIRRRFTTEAIEQLSVHGELLRFRHGKESVVLHLGARAAASWAKAISTPPPTLRQKLGLDGGAQALLIGTCDDAALAEALDGVQTSRVDDAAMVIALVDSREHLLEAYAVCGSLPLWVVYPKGPGVVFGEAVVRETLRAAGARDSKTCAVSERLTATRFRRA
ncbi:hypothetical protein [Agreia sp. Leaf283]|uniref:hypothetical protein n=1 Tax=Agreia sp. Leaf283 TaxID=1736321 RepID=UPI0006F3C708|nr:hypothetical protein [Agreia sp. Leaf283]KQP55790.1 hypothetical protein ASF51_11580 [Agreia sp. Leaf283]